MQVVYCGIGAFFTWLIYALVYEARPSNFLATTIAATFVAFYAFIMSRINKAPSTIFLTASVFPLIPGPNLYYVMYACVSGNMHMLLEQTITLFATCVAIAFGFNFVDIASRTIMRSMKVEYHIGKSDRLNKKGFSRGFILQAEILACVPGICLDESRFRMHLDSPKAFVKNYLIS